MKIKYIFLTSIAVCFFWGTFYAQKLSKESKLIGNWEFINQYNGRGLMMKLKPDHSVIIQMVLADDYTYKIEGKKIITKLEKGSAGKVIIDTSYFELNKNNLIMTSHQNGKIDKKIMKRIPVSKYNSKNIVGLYTWKYPNGHIALSEFTKDGYWKIRLPMENIKGKFSVKDSIIIFNYTSPKTYTEQEKYKFEDKTLVLTRMKTGKKEFYKKVKYFLGK